MTDEELCIKFLTSDVWEDVKIGSTLYKDEYLGSVYADFMHNYLQLTNGKIFVGLINWALSKGKAEGKLHESVSALPGDDNNSIIIQKYTI